jgi:hypothetical protein
MVSESMSNLLVAVLDGLDVAADVGEVTGGTLFEVRMRDFEQES